MMDTTTQLALMTKAKKVFGNDSTFLSFPVTPLTFAATALDFIQDMNYDDLKAFSLLVNAIPDGEAWLPTRDRYIWDTYDTVLNGPATEVAWSSRTEREEAQYQAASQILRAATGGDSAAYTLYKQYRDQMFALQERYAAAKSTGETTTNPALQTHWHTVEEPALRQALQTLETDWIDQGYKHEVEQAQSIKARLGAKSPSTTWQDWRSHFNRDIDQITGTDNVQFFPSSFAPVNAIAEGAWQTFTLTADEIPNLLAQAPAALKERLSPSLQTSDITAITFEFSSAAILRPWFDADLFEANFWRFINSQPPLSDGQTPPSGTCPAYPTAVVFARNIVLTKKVAKPDPQRPPVKLDKAQMVEALQFPTAIQAIQVQPQIRLQPQIAKLSYQPVITSPVNTQIPIALTASSAPALKLTNPAKVATWQSAAVAPSSVYLQTSSPKVFSAKTLTRTPTAIAASAKADTVRPSDATQLSAAFTRLQTGAFVRPQLPMHPGPRLPQPSGDATQTVSESLTQPGEVCILAVICKLLPKCPNPDPTLQW